MSKENRDELKKVCQVIPWRPFTEMARWEEEMERMFGDLWQEQSPVNLTKDHEEDS